MKRLSLEHLESFVAVAEAGGVTAAAQKLGLAQPTVSQHLQRLEARVGRQLVARGPFGTSLTGEGERLLPLARGLLRLDEQFSTAGEGPLRLGACSNIGVYVLPGLLQDFRAAGHPLPDVRIAGNPEIARGLQAGELDLALLEWWAPSPDFEAEVWRREPIVAILPEDDPLAAQAAVSLSDLRARPLLGGERGSGTGRLLQAALAGREPLTVALELGSTEAVKRAVAAGLGVSLVLAGAVTEPGTFAVRPLVPSLLKPLQLVWRMGIGREQPLLAHLRAAAAS